MAQEVWTYFKTPRRKLGMATLIVACVLAAAWLRSVHTVDLFQFHPFSRKTSGVASAAGVIGWFQWDRDAWYHIQRFDSSLASNLHVWQSGPVQLFYFATFGSPLEKNPMWPARISIEQDLGPDRSRLESEGIWGPNVIAKGTMIRMPYSIIVIPVTLLSAWLLLSKPRLGKAITSREDEMSTNDFPEDARGTPQRSR